MDWASNELKAEEDRRNAERIELQAAAQKLIEERGKFDNFHRRIAELVKQVVAQTTEDKILARRAKDDLENRLVQQSRLLTEREFELKHLRGEIEIARMSRRRSRSPFSLSCMSPPRAVVARPHHGANVAEIPLRKVRLSLGP